MRSCGTLTIRFMWKNILSVKVPRNSVLGWIATLGEILTIDNLRKVEKLLWIDALCLRIAVS